MIIRYLLLTFIFIATANSIYGQQTVVLDKAEGDSIVKQATVYFSPGNKEWIEPSQYKTIGNFLKWVQREPSIPIVINGWADKIGTPEQNERFSLLRARTIHNYLLKKGISANRITFQGCGVDTNTSNNQQARRADVIGVIKLTDTRPQEKPIIAETKEEIKKTTEPQMGTANTETSPIPSQQAQQSPVTEKASTVSNLEKEPSRWYIGIGGGVSFGRGTFCSFAMDGTRSGFNVGGVGGYKINKLLSAELSLDYTRMALSAYDCCQLLWLSSDGSRYAAPVAGKNNYQYNDLRSTTNLFGLGAHLNIDLVSIWNDDSCWSALVSPAIYGVYSSATIKQLSTGKSVTDANSFHFGVGADFGVGYQITPCMGIRLTTGINYLTGKGMDGLPKEEHKANYIWNTSLKLIFKL